SENGATLARAGGTCEDRIGACEAGAALHCVARKPALDDGRIAVHINRSALTVAGSGTIASTEDTVLAEQAGVQQRQASRENCAALAGTTLVEIITKLRLTSDQAVRGECAPVHRQRSAIIEDRTALDQAAFAAQIILNR